MKLHSISLQTKLLLRLRRFFLLSQLWTPEEVIATVTYNTGYTSSFIHSIWKVQALTFTKSNHYVTGFIHGQQGMCAPRENLPSDICDQCRYRSGYSFAQSNQGIYCYTADGEGKHSGSFLSSRFCECETKSPQWRPSVRTYVRPSMLTFLVNKCSLFLFCYNSKLVSHTSSKVGLLVYHDLI